MRLKISEVVNYFKACFFFSFLGHERVNQCMNEGVNFFEPLSWVKKKMSLFPRSRKKSLTREKRKKI